MFLSELTDIDYLILKFVSKNEPVSLVEIKRKLSNVLALESRIKNLSTPEYYQSLSVAVPVEDSACLIED